MGAFFSQKRSTDKEVVINDHEAVSDIIENEIFLHDTDLYSRYCESRGLEAYLATSQGRSEINLRCSVDKRTILHLMCRKGARCTFIELSLAAGVELEARDIAGHTAFTLAVVTANAGTVKTLIENNADIHAMTNAGENALHLASYFSTDGPDKLELLCRYPIDHSAADHGGRQPLHIACHTGYVFAIMTLIGMGCDINACDHKQKTPLFYAAAAGKVDVVKILIEADCSLVDIDVDGCNALHHAALPNRFATETDPTIDLLVQHGVDLYQPDNNECAPLDILRNKPWATTRGVQRLEEMYEAADKPSVIFLK